MNDQRRNENSVGDEKGQRGPVRPVALRVCDEDIEDGHEDGNDAKEGHVTSQLDGLLS